MNVWNTINKKVKQGQKFALMYVLESNGSSPGRRGFTMAIDQQGTMIGSIGGGFMEHKLVELAKSLLEKGPFIPFCKKQIHRTNEVKDRSGMICSGEQIVAFYYIDAATFEPFNTETTHLIFTHLGITFETKKGKTSNHSINSNLNQWLVTEPLDSKPNIYIIGGGHIGLALSQIMNLLGFYIILIDDRPNLNTMETNAFYNEKYIVDYNKIGENVKTNKADFIALMSFGYRSDKIVIKQLINHSYAYFGVLGSKRKMETLLLELLKEGIPKEKLDHLHTPIGLKIHSKTPYEIAISIAAQIIESKNRV